MRLYYQQWWSSDLRTKHSENSDLAVKLADLTINFIKDRPDHERLIYNPHLVLTKGQLSCGYICIIDYWKERDYIHTCYFIALILTYNLTYVLANFIIWIPFYCVIIVREFNGSGLLSLEELHIYHKGVVREHTRDMAQDRYKREPSQKPFF